MTFELKDTVDMMNSKDYKERFCAEYFQTEIRYEKLRALLRKWVAGIRMSIGDDSKDKEYQFLGFKPTCPKSLLQRQLDILDELLDIYEARAVIEEIDLHEYESKLNEEAFRRKAIEKAEKEDVKSVLDESIRIANILRGKE